MSGDIIEIDLDHLKEGTSLCFRKSYAFTNNAKFLFEDNRDPDVVSALLVSAIEELGKGLILKEHHSAQNTSIPTWIFGKGRDTHTKKIQRGIQELGEQSLLHPKLFEILSHDDTVVDPDGTMHPPSEITVTANELNEMVESGFGQGYDSMVEYKTQLDQNKKFQLFYIDWNSDTNKWQYGMWHNDFQINNLLSKLEGFLEHYHETDDVYAFDYQ